MIGLLYRNSSIKPKIKSGLTLGIFSGLCGVYTWKLIFKTHPVPYQTDIKTFYKQLFLAHILYILTFTALTAEEKSKLNLSKLNS